MKIYLDTCCYNRPFDNQTQIKINLETTAKLAIQRNVKDGKYDLSWSYVLDYEISKNPYEERKEAIYPWRNAAKDILTQENSKIIDRAEKFVDEGLKSYDALHLACAIESECDYFITTDAKILKTQTEEISIVDPIEFIKTTEEV